MLPEAFLDILNTRNDRGLRINKFIADTGHCSRRQADHLLQEGRVKINGNIASLGDRVKPGMLVEIEGKEYLVSSSESGLETAKLHKIYLAYHKPKGIVCTCDPREKANILDVIQFPQRIFPIGRLDKDSSGLILLTNDGDIVNRILRAEHQHEKEYLVEVNRPFKNEDRIRMERGLPILGQMTLPCKIKMQAPSSPHFRITLIQGLNRQIRRMCEYLGYEVLSLKRVRIMNVSLGSLKIGEYRFLTPKELAQLESLLHHSYNPKPF